MRKNDGRILEQPYVVAFLLLATVLGSIWTGFGRFELYHIVFVGLQQVALIHVQDMGSRVDVVGRVYVCGSLGHNNESRGIGVSTLAIGRGLRTG
jgi:hypothetical protein